MLNVKHFGHLIKRICLCKVLSELILGVLIALLQLLEYMYCQVFHLLDDQLHFYITDTYICLILCSYAENKTKKTQPISY